MLAIAIVIMVVGAALLLAESITPGFAVFGISGVVLLAVSAVLTLLYVEYGIILVLVEVGIIAAGAAMFFKRAKNKKMYGQLILNDSLNEDESLRADLESFLGKEGFAKTSLRPAGVAEIDGVSVEVVSDGTYIKENSRLRVKEIANGKIIVIEEVRHA